MVAQSSRTPSASSGLAAGLARRAAVLSRLTALPHVASACVRAANQALGDDLPTWDSSVLALRSESASACLVAADTTMFVAVRVGAFADPILIGISYELLSAATGLLFGAPSDMASDPRPQRTPTALDEIVLADLAEAYLHGLHTALSDRGVRIEIMAAPGRADLSRTPLVSEDKPIVSLVASARLSAHSGVVWIAIPSEGLEAHAHNLVEVPIPVAPLPAADPEWARRVEAEALRTRVRVEAVLDQFDWSLEQLHRMKPGDRLPLKPDAMSAVVLVGPNEPLFRGALGRQSDTLVVRVDASINASDPIDLTSLLRGHNGSLIEVRA
jgi:flagellar motor switch protein FliM